MSEAVDARQAPLDVITIGRASVDLYGQQIGSRLEDITSFAKSVGGCPANISVGTARLGLRSALLTRVGDEQMGRFIREQLKREGVNTDGLKTDKERLTALVLLSVESEGVSPMIFYRSDCADMALSEEDIDEAFIASARAIVVTGTHFSRPNSDAAQRKAIRIMKAKGGKVVFDIDYRPNLWGLAGHAEGFERYVKSDRVSAQLKTVLPDCDLIVGTEEEIMIASGADDCLSALKTIRALSSATIVLKRGAMGCIVYDGPISDDLEDGIVGEGFPIEIYNVLGAGDAFMSGLLRGWLGGESFKTAATWANACGAFAVSRLLCAPEYPTFEELRFFLKNGSKHRALRKDEAINHIHWATTRRRDIPSLMALACDHRVQLEDVAAKTGADPARIRDFKVLAVKAAAKVAAGRDGYGMLIDEKHGREAMFEFARHPFAWLGRPVELPGSRPLRFEFSQDIGSQLTEWPVDHCIKCLCFYHPDDPAELKEEQQQKLRALFEAARKVGRELLIEIIAGKHGKLDDTTIPRALEELYALGIKPDWWKLEPQASSGAWAKIEAVILKHDPWCRGIVLLGLEAPQDELEAAFAATAKAPIVKGFAVGRTIFVHAAEQWLAGKMSDDEAVADMASRFEQLTEAWLAARGRKAA
ncbi:MULTISPECIES: 5-dehydro-2-deoxygluconokinase [unclassified Mesorhizobium]|uniref:bifunctional 5-dehydro-2-deoxygluconokinase/5-dehydro-2- deoxyphosphogluconate aldolase n=1 Tax=unclassified Mesorhizobium TaxID=325217 RepID=UPI000FDA6CDB|nr:MULTISPECIES: 5-dehydro-2-deoxygluconokinase [unclassified Mesorhizobium]TGR42674.1 5-dehydro-2-deoxygluconokinase [bacterium M00.F.Ca.ET.199.01.1.1]TGU30156.1 5-dehydro-2-deoxygluconokinase [bacterium M00.F.Ca.ET.156.01.1.1]TGV84884.1 5-dehydro-2-deoxygluconokinase [Mesorhizobium sp. M00.F.Ca.ET.149.01.1.1]TGR24246.1 5-dehydro-2-deoxygluconokinase [Mesorhizobium sp. M8A.F.Ca.ET.202.01.1.1]TGR26878.1 5-dehydro-2-deoxygluconokinase [Mesorhizobium sp. M8A.F.Ca.ET.197.01.1.1]